MTYPTEAEIRHAVTDSEIRSGAQDYAPEPTPAPVVTVQLPEPMAVEPDSASFGACVAFHTVDGAWHVEVTSGWEELTASEARGLVADLLAAARWVEQRDGTEPFAEVDTDGAGCAP